LYGKNKAVRLRERKREKMVSRVSFRWTDLLVPAKSNRSELQGIYLFWNVGVVVGVFFFWKKKKGAYRKENTHTYNFGKQNGDTHKYIHG